MIYLGSPATSLLVGAAVPILLNCHELLTAHLIGQSALQIVVVLIGLNLDAKQLVVSSVPIVKHTDSTLFDENGSVALKSESRAESPRLSNLVETINSETRLQHGKWISRLITAGFLLFQ